MRPEDFFKTIEDGESSRKEGALLSYAERIIKKYFLSMVDPGYFKSVMRDPNIKDCDKLYAVRERAEDYLARVHFFRTKTDLYELITRGYRHDVVKELVDVMQSDGLDIVVFPVYKRGNWVAHNMGMSPDARKKPRIIIPGDGVSVTIQMLDNFVEEYITE